MNIGLDSDHHRENLPVLVKTIKNYYRFMHKLDTTVWLEIVRVAVGLELESDK